MNLTQLYKNIACLFAFTYLLVSCQQERLSEDLLTATSFETLSDDYLVFSSVDADLQHRTQLINEVLILEDSVGRGRNSSGGSAAWVQVAELATLDVNGQLLSATHVIFVDDLALVSYHKRGEVHLGAVEVINLSDRANPTVAQQIIFKQADVNSIAIDPELIGNRRKIWLALSDSKKGAVLGEVLLKKNGKFANKEIKIIDLSKYLDSGVAASANAVARAEDFVYVTAGKSHGGTFCFSSKNLDYIGHSAYPNAKYIAYNGNTVVSLQTGNSARLKIDKPGGFSFLESYNVGVVTHQNVDLSLKGKNTLHFDEVNSNIVYIATGKNGLIALDVNTGNRLYQSPGDMLQNGNTNGLTTDQDYLYLANGADGLSIFSLPVVNTAQPAIFHWDLNESNASANFVQTNQDWVFVAKGTGGLKILKKPQKGELLPLGTFNNRGRPDNLETDRPVCDQILQDIFNKALPNGVNATINRPEFFEQPINKIILQESAKVYVTFVHEGAGYLNTLGFYYYDKNNPPKSSEDLTKIVIFPNASAKNSGGDLVPGNTMKVLGNFPKNTVIEFFLIANGFKNGKITAGNGTIYTNPQFNANQKVQSLFLYDRACDATVLSMEDIALPGGDKDFNDVIFQIRTSPKSAMDVNSFIHL